MACGRRPGRRRALDRLARSLPDATDIADELTKKGVALNLGGAAYDPTDPVDRLLFYVLGMVAEFEADLIRARTHEGMAIAKAAGKLRGRKPKLTASLGKHLVQSHRTGRPRHQRDTRTLRGYSFEGVPRYSAIRAIAGLGLVRVKVSRAEGQASARLMALLSASSGQSTSSIRRVHSSMTACPSITFCEAVS